MKKLLIIIFTIFLQSNAHSQGLDSHKLIWKFKTEGTLSTSPICFSDGLSDVLIAADEDKYLYAIDSKSGKEKWKFKTNDTITKTPVSFLDFLIVVDDKYLYALDINNGRVKGKFKDETFRGPALPIICNGIVIFESYREVFGLDLKTGKVKWQNLYESHLKSEAVVFEETVFFPEDSNVHALDINTGKEKWIYKTSFEVESPVIAGEYLLLCDFYGLIALDIKTGKLKWRKPIDGHVYTPIVKNDLVYFDFDVKGAQEGHYIACLSISTGDWIWNRQTRKTLFSNRLVLGLGKVFIEGEDNYLFGFDAQTGEIPFLNKMTDKFLFRPTLADLGVYFVNHDNNLYSVDTLGTVKFIYKTVDEILYAPLVVNGYAVDKGNDIENSMWGGFFEKNGVIYLGCADKYIYAVEK